MSVRLRLVHGAACCLAAALVAACSKAPVPVSPSSPTSVATVARPAMPAAATGAALPADHATTARYRIAIDYPVLPSGSAALDAALRASGDAAKREFMRALPDPQRFPEFADRRLELLVRYEVAAATPRFISVRGQGMADTGGAHPLPLQATFVFDRAAGRVVTLGDLFTDPAQAWPRLATFAREALRAKLLAKAPGADEASPEARREWLANMGHMIDDGTQPNAADFAHFLAGADGVTLVFPPYQVAPYVYGTQLVDVPAARIVALLRPEYRGAFASMR